MPLFIKNSILYILIDKILIKPYDNSLLKKNLVKITNYYKQSFIYNRIENYLNKSPYFLNSIYYKFIRKIVSIIDKIMDFLHKTIKKWLLGSNSFFELRSVKYSTIEKNLLLISVLIATFNLAYTITSIIFDTLNIYISFVLLAITLILLIFSRNKNCYRESFIYKIFKSW